MFGQLFARLKAAEKSLDESHGFDISTPEARRKAQWHFRWIDHGILRSFWTNQFEIAPGVWRSNQPDRQRIEKYTEMGIRTVINLRGVTNRSPYLFEKEACDDLGVEVISHRFSARSLPKKKEILNLLTTFDTIEKPFVMHCKSGADRAGLAAALYLLHSENASIEDAKKQLSFKYLHIRSSSTGILDHFLEQYEQHYAKAPISIREWVKKHYNRKATKRSYTEKKNK